MTERGGAPGGDARTATGDADGQARSGKPPILTRALVARIVLWFLLVVSIFFFIAIMFGGLRPDR